MLMKYIYKTLEDNTVVVDYLSLANTGASEYQNFSTRIVTKMLEEGLMEIPNATTLLLHTYPETLRYTIKRKPGRYCLHCGEKLDDDTGGEMARLHLAQKHKGKKSPNPNIPSGYEWLTYFECVLNPEQHEKYRVKLPARAPHYPLKEKET